jgi:hypothetical protein
MKMTESDNESEKYDVDLVLGFGHDVLKGLEERVIALERALEAVLTKIEDAEHPQAHGHDQPGWFGVTE